SRIEWRPQSRPLSSLASPACPLRAPSRAPAFSAPTPPPPRPPSRSAPAIRSSVSVRESLFFFQAEDGIRDWSVTGVQTCALPICSRRQGPPRRARRHRRGHRERAPLPRDDELRHGHRPLRRRRPPALGALTRIDRKSVV